MDVANKCTWQKNGLRMGISKIKTHNVYKKIDINFYHYKFFSGYYRIKFKKPDVNLNITSTNKQQL